MTVPSRCAAHLRHCHARCYGALGPQAPACALPAAANTATQIDKVYPSIYFKLPSVASKQRPCGLLQPSIAHASRLASTAYTSADRCRHVLSQRMHLAEARSRASKRPAQVDSVCYDVTLSLGHSAVVWRLNRGWRCAVRQAMGRTPPWPAVPLRRPS